jgi:UTP-glucose-1-phosphate uridylyltransferase
MTEKVKGPKSYFPSIESKYGKPIANWMKELKKVKDLKHLKQVAFLKQTHGMGHGHANAVAEVFRAENIK